MRSAPFPSYRTATSLTEIGYVRYKRRLEEDANGGLIYTFTNPCSEARTGITLIAVSISPALPQRHFPDVNFFLNKFRKLGFIDYNGDLCVHICTPGVQL